MRLARWWGSLDHPRDIPVLLAMQVWLTWGVIALRTRPLSRIIQAMRPREAGAERASDHRCATLARYARFVVWLNRAWARNVCLYQCLLLYRFLRLEGRDAEIAFGVRRDGDRVEGHTWILLDDHLFDDTEEQVGRYELAWVTTDSRSPVVDTRAGLGL